MTDQYFEEEEFTTQFTGQTTLRIVQLTKPHWKWVLGFILMITLVAVLDSYFTFLSAQIIDEAILGENTAALRDIITRYGSLILVQAAGVLASSTWQASWVKESVTICAKACSSISKSFLSLITTSLL